jgi:hypothetical protein
LSFEMRSWYVALGSRDPPASISHVAEPLPQPPGLAHFEILCLWKQMRVVGTQGLMHAKQVLYH